MNCRHPRFNESLSSKLMVFDRDRMAATKPCRNCGKPAEDMGCASRKHRPRRPPFVYWEHKDEILPTPTLQTQCRAYLAWSSRALKPATRFAWVPVLSWVWRAISPQDQPTHGPLTNLSQSAPGLAKTTKPSGGTRAQQLSVPDPCSLRGLSCFSV